MEPREVTAGGDRAVSCFGRFEGLLAEDDCDGVDGGVHGLDPPKMGLDDFWLEACLDLIA